MNSQFINISRKRHGTPPVWVMLSLICTFAFALVSEAANFKAISKSALVDESCTANGVIDPGETNTVTFRFKNQTGGALTELKARLRTGTPVAPSGTTAGDGAVETSISGEVTIGSVAKDAEFEVAFRFRVNGACGDNFNPSFIFNGKKDGNTFSAIDTSSDGLDDSSKFAFRLGQTVETSYTFNGGAVTIRDNDTASPYPSTLSASGVPSVTSNVVGERVARVEVTLKGVTHGFARDLNLMLRGPQGQQIILMREAGGNTSATAGIAGADITFAQADSLPLLPVSSQITTGRYRPSDYSSGAFRSEGTATSGTLNSMFAGVDANGTWRLFAFDDSPGDSGSIANGWELKVITTKIVCCGDGATAPTITQGTNPTRTNGIGNLTGGSGINEDTENFEIAFNADDIESGGGGLTFRATSSNQNVIQDSQFEFNDAGDSGTGSERTRKLKIKKLVANAFGTVTITVFAKDGNNQESSASFNLEVKSVNDAPTFTAAVRNQSVNIGARTPALSFTIDDVEDSEDALIVTATAVNSGTTAPSRPEDPAIVPNSNLFLSGTGATRTITVIPAQEGSGGTTGQATVTITVRDSNGATPTSSFIIRFEADRDQPTISPITDVTFNEDTVKRVPFTVRAAAQPATGAQSTASALVITRQISISSGDSDLIATAVVEGTGEERELVLTPAAHKFGSGSITVNVSDGVKNRSSTFNFTVTAVNDKPSISGLPAQVTIPEDSATADVVFNIADIETSNLSDFAIGASSGKRITVEVLPSDSSIVPNTIVSDNDTPGLKFGGTGANRTIRVKPHPNQFGKVTIKLTINDNAGGDDAVASTSFIVNVDAVNDAPILGSVRRNSRDGTAGTSTPGWPLDDATGDKVLADNANDAVIQVDEDAPGLDGDGNPREAQLLITGITAGPTASGAKEFDQTVALSMTRDDPNGVIQSASFDPGTVQESQSGSASTKIKIKINKEKFGDVVFTITGSDSAGLSTTKRFKLQVNPVNDTPTFNGTGAGGSIPDQQVGIGQTVVVPITLSDVETSAANMLVVTKTSSATGVIATDSIVLDGGKTKVAITSSGSATVGQTSVITLEFRDRGARDNNDPANSGLLTAQRQFTVTIADIPVNNPPTLDLADSSRTIQEDGVATTTITVADPGGDVNTVSLSATSSDPNLVPVANVLFGGSGASRNVAFVPASNANGTATITITATDQGVTINGQTGQNKLSVSKTFTLTVTGVEDAPTISLKQSGPIFSDEDAEVKDTRTDSDFIEITVGDAETALDSLTLSASVTDTLSRDIVAANSITFEGTGATRRVRFTPAANKNTLRLSDGVNVPITITLKVRDGAGQEATTSFDLYIRAKNDAPTLDDPTDLVINEDAGTQTIVLTGIRAGGSEFGPLNGTALNLTIAAVATAVGNDNSTDLIATPITVTPSTITVTDGSASHSATLTFSPSTDKFGEADIKITVTDNSGAAVSQTGGSNGSGGAGSISSAVDSKTVTQRVKITVNSVNDRPSINPIQDVSMQQDTTFGPVAITIDDKETLAANLQVTFDSSNTALVPNNITDPNQPGLQPTGSGNNRGVIIRPIAGASGQSTITVTVTDGASGGSAALTTNTTFRVTVVAGQRPLISTIPDVTVNASSFTDVISFTVTDAQTAAAALTVRAESLNTAIIPTGNIQFGPVNSSTPTARTMIIRTGETPGVAEIRVTVRDGDGQESSTTFRLTVRGEAPTVSAIADQTVQKGGTTGAIAFTVADKETFPGFLTVTAQSSNPAFVPSSGIALAGVGANRTITVTPVATAEGESTITVTVTDAEGQTGTRTFKVGTPVVPNEPPTLSSIGPQSTEKDKPTSVITFTLGDDNTAVADFASNATTGARINAASSDQAVVPNANIFLGGSGANRTVFIQPATGAEGTTTITITATDAGPGTPKSASVSFTLTVAANVAPTISSISAQSTDRNKATSAIAFTVGDTETAAASLVVTASSSNPIVVPTSGVVLGGTGANRTVTVTPGNNQVGTVTITLTVTDGGGKTATSAFQLTINQTAPAKGDIDGDGESDIMFQDGNGFIATWIMNGTSLNFSTFFTPSNTGDTNFRIVGTGDFNRNGQEDLLYQHTDGTLAVWYMSSFDQVDAALLNPAHPGDSNWRVAGTGDINKDGKVDVVFQHTDGTLAVWYLDGVNLSSAALLDPSHPGDRNWRVVGIADLNADSNQDIVFQHTDGSLAYWAMNGVRLTSAAMLNPGHPGSGWRVVGTADRNKDGRADILFQHTDGSVAVWLMNGSNLTSASMLNPGNAGFGWQAVAPR